VIIAEADLRNDLSLELRRFGNFLSTEYSLRANVFAIGGAAIFWTEHPIHKTAGTACAAQD
jgi:hypothetical protein